MITIIFAPPKTGKTAKMVYILSQFMFDSERNKLMKKEIENKNLNGFNLTIPKHCVHTNFDLIGKKFGCNPRKNYTINPFRLGFANKVVKTHFIPPYSVIGITEGQKYFNSRMSLYYPDWQSRWFEQHGHNHLDIYIDVQRPMLIDVNIRELSSFIEIRKMTKKYDKNGRISKVIFLIRKIESSSELDKYFSSGKKDTSCYIEEEITADGSVLSMYDCRNCKPKFYDGHFEEDFDLNEYEPAKENLESYIKYLEENDDELPQGFYQKRSTA